MKTIASLLLASMITFGIPTMDVEKPKLPTNPIVETESGNGKIQIPTDPTIKDN